ncbi:MAG: terpene cyclase/mutase family protein [Planctomycetaceae bacterium]|nr:terpene cyclase/mutase family protein [Planctomycetaceae bacterium]
MHWRRLIPASLVVLTVALVTVEQSLAAEPSIDSMTARAVEFLRTTQADDGSWTSPEQPGISALVVASLLKSGVPIDDPTVARGLKHLESFIQADGGIYFTQSGHKNYETSIALVTFDAANKDGRYDDVIRKAADYIRGIQWDESEGIDKTDIKFGGAGYGRSGDRPDLSNTSFLVDALIAAGVSKDDPAVQNALVFVSRCQNLESQNNTTEFAAKINDGGFYYTPAAGGTSQAGANPDGGLRSYASMTYAGLKSMIHAGLTPDDPRVAAATKWIQKFYSLDENPGMGQVGLYYYYHTFAKALDVAGQDEFVDAAGVQHDWRHELVEHLASRQQENGSWVNTADRWYEGNPSLVTAYSLLALEYCHR